MDEDWALSIDVSLVDTCDNCGSRNPTAWLSGTVGIYGLEELEMPLVTPLGHPDRPDRLGELHLHLCRDCVLAALGRTEPNSSGLEG